MLFDFAVLLCLAVFVLTAGEAVAAESAPIRLSAKDLVPGTNPIVFDMGAVRSMRGTVVDWRPFDAAEKLPLECVDLGGFFNDRVAEIFKHEYRSPRSPCCSLQIPLHGFGDWCYGGRDTPTIDDAALRIAAGPGGRFVSPQGIPLATPGPGNAPNIIFTSLWDNFPKEVEVPLDPARPLRSLTVRCLANDVVVGLMSATLLRPAVVQTSGAIAP